MPPRSRASVSVEQLEERLTPASVRQVGGFLFIRNPRIAGGPTNITLTQTAPNTFNVRDAGASQGTFANIGSILVTGTSARDTVILDLAGKTFTGDFLANTGNGNDTVVIRSSGGAGAILGRTTLL